MSERACSAADVQRSVEAYVDYLDAALVDGFIASFERDRLAEFARATGLSSERLAHIHRGYFIAMAVTAWADAEITFDEEAQLTMIASALSIPIPEAVDMVVLARDIEPPLIVSGLGLTSRDRIAFADPLGTGIPDWHARAQAVGLVPTHDVLAARFVVTADPNDACHEDTWRAGAMVVAEWAFDSAIEMLEQQRRQRGLVL